MTDPTPPAATNVKLRIRTRHESMDGSWIVKNFAAHVGAAEPDFSGPVAETTNKGGARATWYATFKSPEDLSKTGLALMEAGAKVNLSVPGPRGWDVVYKPDLPKPTREAPERLATHVLHVVQLPATRAGKRRPSPIPTIVARAFTELDGRVPQVSEPIPTVVGGLAWLVHFDGEPDATVMLDVITHDLPRTFKSLATTVTAWMGDL